MKWTLKKQLFLLCSIFLAILVGVSSLSFVNSTTLMSQFDNVAEVQLPAVRYMTLADMTHDALRSVVLASLLAAERENQEDLKASHEEAEEKSQDFRKNLSNLRQLQLNTETQAAITETVPQMEEYIQHTLKIVDMSRNQGYQAALAELPQFNESFKFLEEKMEKLGDLIEVDAARAHATGGTLRTVNLIVSILGAIVCLFGGYWITRGLVRQMTSFTRRIEETGESLDKTSSHLSKASQSLAQGATQSAASLEETVASLEQLSSMVNNNSGNAKSASGLSSESFEASRAGAESVQRLIQSMDSVRDSSNKIEEVIQVIDDIAFQTNLLALNASVEAARAGEMGKGFAVVADAVRSLAQRSADSAKDISKMIQDSVTKIHEGGQMAHQSGELINKFLESAQKVMDINNEISGASNEQARGINLISAAMNKLDQSSQSNAQVAQDVAQTSEQMSELSQGMQKLVVELKDLIGK
ncbi:MAG: methyl-accepting chemotaxis protein [Bdellovibrio sp.]